MAIVVVLMLSSQTRPAITAMIFILVALRFSRRHSTVKFYHLALLMLGGIAIVAVVQGMRTIGFDEFATSENQFTYAVEHAIPYAVTATTESSPEVFEKIVDRAGATINFLAAVIYSINEGESHSYGEGIVQSLYSLVPRFVWEDKPAVLAPQLIAEDFLKMRLNDAPLGPITQFYLEFDAMGVIIGYWGLGWFLGWLTNLWTKSTHVGVFFIYSFIWSHVVNLEQELILGILSILRNALIAYAFYRCVFALVSLASARRLVPVGPINSKTST